MNIWMTLILAVQLLSALVMIGLVLIQHGKGADMGASFGSGASGSLFGATGSANFLSRATAACATTFFLATLFLAYLGNQGTAGRREAGNSVLDRPAIAASAPATGAIPGALPASAAGANTVPQATPGTAATGAAPAASAAAGVPAPMAAPMATTTPAAAPASGPAK